MMELTQEERDQRITKYGFPVWALIWPAMSLTIEDYERTTVEEIDLFFRFMRHIGAPDHVINILETQKKIILRRDKND